MHENLENENLHENEENIFALNIMSSTTRTSAQDLCYSEVISSKTLYIPILDIVFVTFSLLSGKIKKWEAEKKNSVFSSVSVVGIY